MDHSRTVRRDVHVRLSDDLYARLKRAAEIDRRSIANQVAVLLDENLPRIPRKKES